MHPELEGMLTIEIYSQKLILDCVLLKTLCSRFRTNHLPRQIPAARNCEDEMSRIGIVRNDHAGAG